MNPSQMTSYQIEEFLEQLRKDGKKRNLIAEYRRNLYSLYQVAEETDHILSRSVLERWKEEQLQKGIAQGTMTNRIVKINHFLRYWHLESLCFPNGGRIDLTGKQFGNLIAIEPTSHRSADRSICWRCRCITCGREKEIPANQLKKGAQISCGCNRASRLQKTNGYVEGTCLKNILSDKVSRNNTSGYKGVFRKRGKWAAQIQYKKKVYYLGSYDRMEDAIGARKTAENWVHDDAEKLLERIKEMS